MITSQECLFIDSHKLSN